MHTGSTHFSDVGKERLQPLTNEPVRAEHGGWLHAESIRPRFYNLTTTSLKRQPYEGLTASRTESQKSLALEWKDWAIHPILPKKYSTTKRPLKRTQEQCLRHISEVTLHEKSALFYHFKTGCVVSVLPLYKDTTLKNVEADSDHSQLQYTVTLKQVHPSNINANSVISGLKLQPEASSNFSNSTQNVCSSPETVVNSCLDAFTAIY